MSAHDAFGIFSQLSCLRCPRPNGSRALARAVGDVRSWLEAEGIAVQAHHFVLRPFFMELMGLWLVFAGLLLTMAALGRWGWVGLALSLVTVAVPLLEVRFLHPTVTALILQPACNLVVRFPAPKPCREVILSAHLDSKTELLDHHQRSILLRLGRPAMWLALGAGLLTALDSLLPPGTVRLVAHWQAVLAVLPVAVYGLGTGANLVGGRFSRRPSTGALDNGAAVAVLLDLALRLHRGALHFGHTSITLLFTVGEEVQMQGALAYVQHAYDPGRRDRPLPMVAVNLEVVGQDGGYLLWERDGTAMLQMPVDAALSQALARAIEAVAGDPPMQAGLINSDAFAFLRAGIPATTLGGYDADLGERGFHSDLDNPSRIDRQRLVETIAILSHLMAEIDSEE